MDDPSRTKLCLVLFQASKKVFAKILVVTLFSFFLCVEMVEISKKLIEPVKRRQMFVTITQMIFAKWPVR